MDNIAYSGEDGKPYLVDSSISSEMDGEARKLLVVKFKSEGLTDSEITARIKTLETMMMDLQISKSHPLQGVRTVAKQNFLSEDDKEEIYATFNNVDLPTPLRQVGPYDEDNPDYSSEDCRKDSLRAIGMHIVSPNSFQMRKVRAGESLSA